MMVVTPSWGGTYLYPLPQGVQVFDDSVFNLKEPKRKEINHHGRYYDYDDDFDYTPAQRKAWIKKCSPQMDTDFKSFQDCFEAQKLKTESRY